MRRKTFRGAVVALLLIGGSSLFLGCDTHLFSANLFQGFDDGAPSASEVLSSYNANDPDAFLNALTVAGSSDEFYEDLSDEDREKIITNLEEIYQGDGDPETVSEAAALAGQTALQGTDAGEMVNNVVDLLSSDGDFGSVDELLTALVPDGVRDDADAVKQILTDFTVAAAAYRAFGEEIREDLDGDGTLDSPADVNMGEVAQNAVIAILVDTIVSDLDNGIDELTSAIVNDDYTSLEDLDPVEDANAAGSALNKILEAGGLGGLLDEV